ncbi:MAG: hypothetical protein ACI8ZM_005607 [Crocinitomix sp.]|jgi:hypothetical protein
MKKIYTLIAVMAFTFSASAQFDLSCEFATYTAGSTVADDPMDGTIVITNEGEDIAIGDTLTFGYIIDGDSYSLALDAGFYNFFITEEVFVSGTTLSFGDPALAWAALGIDVDLCATVYGIGALAVPDFTGDADPTDNSSCITYELPDAPIDDTGIEDLNLVLSNVYVAAGQLMIVNEGANDDVQANLNIVNMNGQTVQTENFALATGTSIVELNNLSAGIYIVAIEVEGAVITRKISIQ